MTVGNREEHSNFTLILHIGAGKTGSSSIQTSLRNARQIINDHGYDYWGRMLEYAPTQKYDWQRSEGAIDFINTLDQSAHDQILDVLLSSIEEIRSSGYCGAVWSNESFFRRAGIVVPALKKLQSKANIVVVCYLRSHDSWAKSAYVQWGIKHKTYRGPVLPFAEYNETRPVKFADALELWSDAFPKNLIVRNYDTSRDVVDDFVSCTNLPAPISAVRTNTAPNGTELLLRAVYNNTERGRIRGAPFTRQMKSIDFDFDVKEWFKSLLPTQQMLAGVAENSREDREIVNRLLENSGDDTLVPKTRDDREVTEELEVDWNNLVSVLTQVVMKQTKEIEQLKKDCERMSQAIENISGGRPS